MNAKDTYLIFKRAYNAKAPLRVDTITVQWYFDAANSQDSGNAGCVVVAEVSYPIEGNARRIEQLKSGGLWGIGNNLTRGERLEVESEQVHDLESHLARFGLVFDNEIRAAILTYFK